MLESEKLLADFVLQLDPGARRLLATTVEGAVDAALGRRPAPPYDATTTQKMSYLVAYGRARSLLDGIDTLELDDPPGR